jgi:hypothetical protein
MELALGAETPLAADIVFRSMQRLGQALAGRIERLEEATERDPSGRPDASIPALPAPAPVSSARRGIRRIATLLASLSTRGPAAGPVRRPSADRLASPHSPARP